MSHVLEFTTYGKLPVVPPPGSITLFFPGLQFQTQDLRAPNATFHKDCQFQVYLKQKLYLTAEEGFKKGNKSQKNSTWKNLAK